jgi:hypothetical protein
MSEGGAQLAYSVAEDGAGYAARPSRVFSASVFADRPHVRCQIAEDAAAAGLRIARMGEVSAFLDSAEMALGDVVLVDVPYLDAGGTAALSLLDVRAARSGVDLIVSTSIGMLDPVFGCLDQSGAQILVTPTRAELVLAIGRVLTRTGRGVRELSEEDRITLLRLSQQVEEMARKLEQISAPPESTQGDGPAFRFESPSVAFRAPPVDSSERLVRAARPPLPDPRLLRRIIRQRQLRARFFEGDLFADPAWDMLLDLAAARAEHVRVSVTSLCIASAVPPTTALRWISQMTDMGLLERVNDETDRRRAFITLTDKAADAVARYFAELGSGASKLI